MSRNRSTAFDRGESVYPNAREAHRRRWGHLTLKEVRRSPRVYRDAEGNPYEGGDYDPDIWVLLCECGREFEIRETEFPGRRRMRSCGKADCEYSARQESNPLAGAIPCLES